MKTTITCCLFCFLTLVLSAQTPVSQKPFVLGITETLHSSILNEDRILNIYLPPAYLANDTSHFPVVFLLDGGADEDFIHTVGLYQYNNFPWIDRVPQSIIVGIANTDRKRDFTTTGKDSFYQRLLPSAGGAEKFVRFLSKELQPYVAARYRGAEDRTLIGQSLAGLLASRVLWFYPDLFNRYIIISPSLWWNDGELLKTQPVAAIANVKQVYVAVGKEGLAPGNTPHVMEVDANIFADQVRKYAGKHTQIVFDYLPEEDHATVGHPALFRALRLLFPDPQR